MLEFTLSLFSFTFFFLQFFFLFNILGPPKLLLMVIIEIFKCLKALRFSTQSSVIVIFI